MQSTQYTLVEKRKEKKKQTKALSKVSEIM